MKKFEYQIIKCPVTPTAWYSINADFDYDSFQQKLNEEGEKGWELVTCFTTKKGIPTYSISAILKRETP